MMLRLLGWNAVARLAASARKTAKTCMYRRRLRRFRRLCRAIGRLAATPVFVKVGANDGVTLDPCSDIFLAGANWSGVLIEPVPYCIERLRRHFADPERFVCEQVAIGEAGDSARFYYVDERARRELPGLPAWHDQVGSFDRHHIVKHLDGVLEPFIIDRDVPVRRLTDVLASHAVRRVHVLHVDVEGYDDRVLSTLDFERYTPLVIFIEHAHLPTARKRIMRRFLRDKGYRVTDCRKDYLAVKRGRWRLG